MSVSVQERPKARFAPRRLAHANIFVRDLDESLAFHSAVCGLTEVFKEPGVKMTFLSNGSSHHGVSHSIYPFDPEQMLQEFYADAMADWKGFYKGNQFISGSWDPFAAKPSSEALCNADFSPEYVEAAPVHPREITRATLVVRGFEAMLAFHQDVDGLTVLHLDRQAGVAVLAGTTGKPCLALFAAADGEAAGLHHISFELVNEIELEKLHGDLRRINAVPVEVMDGPGKKGVVMKSPDGFLLEFYLPTPGRAWSAGDACSPRDLHLV